MNDSADPSTKVRHSEERAVEYRELAIELVSEAQLESDSELRDQLIEMANTSLAIAKRIELLAGVSVQPN